MARVRGVVVWIMAWGLLLHVLKLARGSGLRSTKAEEGRRVMKQRHEAVKLMTDYQFVRPDSRVCSRAGAARLIHTDRGPRDSRSTRGRRASGPLPAHSCRATPARVQLDAVASSACNPAPQEPTCDARPGGLGCA